MAWKYAYRIPLVDGANLVHTLTEISSYDTGEGVFSLLVSSSRQLTHAYQRPYGRSVQAHLRRTRQNYKNGALPPFRKCCWETSEDEFYERRKTVPIRWNHHVDLNWKTSRWVVSNHETKYTRWALPLTGEQMKNDLLSGGRNDEVIAMTIIAYCFRRSARIFGNVFGETWDDRMESIGEVFWLAQWKAIYYSVYFGVKLSEHFFISRNNEPGGRFAKYYANDHVYDRFKMS